MKILAALPLAACLIAPAATAGHPEKTPDKPSQTLNVENLDAIEFTAAEIRIMREQIKAAQERAGKARLKAKPETEHRSLKEALEDIKLPTEAEIEEIQAQLPDLNAMVAGMMKLATDEDMKKGMTKSADRLREKFDTQNFETKDGTPDLNAMMATMLSLMGDEELVGGMIEAIEPIAEMMEGFAPEATKTDKD